MAQLYTAGAGVEVAALDAPWRAARQKLSLPLYPFQRQRYWVEPPQGAGPKAPKLEDCLYRIAWEPKPAPAALATGAERWLLVADRGGVAAALGAELEKARQGCLCVAADDPAALAAALAQQAFTRVAHLGSLDTGPIASLDDLRAAQRSGIESVLALAQELLRRQWTGKLWLVTRGTQRVRDPDVVEPAQAPLWGFGKALGMEHPEIWGGLLDLPPETATDAAADVAAVLQADDREDQVALRDGTRHVSRLRPMQLKPAPRMLTVRTDASYLITGGLGGIGLDVAQRLVQRGARHVVLTSRRAPAPAALAAIARLEREGCRVEIVHADVSQEPDATRLLDLLTETVRPPLRGIVHAAGVSPIAAIEAMDSTHLQAVLAPKVYGGWLLDRLSTQHAVTLDFFICTSSIASAWGSTMQAAYAASNAYLDALVAQRAVAGRPATVLNFGPWAQTVLGMSTAENQDWLRSRGINALATALATDALEVTTAAGATQVIVADVNWTTFREVLEVQRLRPFFMELGTRAAEGSPAAEAGAETELVRRLREAPEAERGELLQVAILEELSRVIGKPAGELRTDVGFFDLGIDSLMAVEFRNALSKRVGQKLAATVVMDAPDVRRLAEYLTEQVLKLTPPAPARRPGPSSTATPGGPIAIVGLSCRFPGAPDAEAFWSLLERGAEGIGEIPADRWNVDAYYDPEDRKSTRLNSSHRT